MKNNYLKDEEIQAVLYDYDGQVDLARERISAINSDLVRLTDSIYEYVSWYDGGGGERKQEKGNTGDPVAFALEKKGREYIKYRQEFLKALASQEDRLILMQKVRLAYLSLPQDEYLALKTLYEEGVPWKAAAEKLAFSKRKLIQKRKLALEHIRAYIDRMDTEEETSAAADEKVFYGGTG